MARDTYGVTTDDVLGDIGGADVRRVGANSAHISTTNVQNWINRAAGRLNGIVAAEKLSVTTDQAKDLMAMAIIAYAKARVYERLNRHEAKNDAEEEFDELVKSIREFSEEVHEASTDAGRVQSNIDVSDPTKRKFVTYNTTRKDGFEGW